MFEFDWYLIILLLWYPVFVTWGDGWHMASFAAKKAAITTAVSEQLGACRSWVVFVHIVMESLSHLVVMFAAWYSTAYVVPVYLLLHFLIAMEVTDLSVRQLLEAPLLWLFPTSRLVASSRPCAAQGARLCSWLLRLAMMVWFIVDNSDDSLKRFDTERMCHQAPSHSCQGLPPWMQTPRYDTWLRGSRPSCLARHDVYSSCLSELPWFRRGYCNGSGGDCALEALPKWLLILSGAMTYVAPCLGFVVTALLDLGGSCSKQLEAVPGAVPGTDDASEEHSSSEEEPKCFETGSAWLKRASYAGKTIVPFYLDVVLDMNGVVQYILTGNYIFAAVSGMIFLASLSQQLSRGAILKLWNATCESLKNSQSTDDLEMIMLSEKSVEAPLQLLLQFYAFPFVTSSDVAVFSFLFSLLLSLKSVAEATYCLAELKLHSALVTQEYESLPWALWDVSRKKMGLHLADLCWAETVHFFRTSQLHSRHWQDVGVMLGPRPHKFQ